MKRVRFWGTRGSLPVALTAAGVRAKIEAALRGAVGHDLATEAGLQRCLSSLPAHVTGTYGGHTSCVEIETGSGEYVLCDLGTGVRPFGQAAMARHGSASPQTFHIFMSHLHWDHIMGLPFFAPAYFPANRVCIYGGHEHLEAALRRQQEPPSFPVDFSIFGARVEFIRLEPDRDHRVAGMTVRTLLQHHTGDSYGYRFSAGGRTIVYTTDSEHRLDNAAESQRFIEFFRGADLVIFDAMYSLADTISVKADWGHSSNIVGVDLCLAAGVRTLCLFHHEPVHGDEALDAILAETRRYEEIARTGARLDVVAAFDGMEFDL